jgi:hypothetical protein
MKLTKLTQILMEIERLLSADFPEWIRSIKQGIAVDTHTNIHSLGAQVSQNDNRMRNKS